MDQARAKAMLLQRSDFVLSSQGIRIVVDAVIVKHGRAQAAVVLGSGLAPLPKAEEVRYARIVAGRMARAMRGG